MTIVEEIRRSVAQLSDPERDALVDTLISERESQQAAVIKRRIAEIESGDVEGIPVEKVMFEARSMLDDRA